MQQQHQKQQQLEDEFKKQQADKKELDSDTLMDYTNDEDQSKKPGMTKDEAERLLDAYKRRERSMPSDDTGSKTRPKDRPYKDW